MKWSEQMRVLQSEDEHYNQLVYDVEENSLYINDELIATLAENKSLDQNKFLELKKKYPYIDDKNFLLTCLFKFETGTSTYTSSTPSQFMTGYFHPSLVRYTKSNEGTVIEVELHPGDGIYIFTLLKPDNI